MIKLIIADTLNLSFAVINNTDQSPADLSTVTARLMIKKSLTDKIPKVTKELIHPVSNILNFEVTADETATLAAGQYNIGLKLYYDSGVEITQWQDLLVAEKGVFDE